MNAKDVIKASLETGMYILTAYLQDLDDSDMKARPGGAANSIAWQLGHLISSEYKALTALGAACPELTEEFLKAYEMEKAPLPDMILSKDEYLKLYAAQREATLSFLASLSEEKLSEPGPDWMRDYAPTVGAALFNAGNSSYYAYGSDCGVST